MISAENELGMEHQPLITASPRAQISFSVFLRMRPPSVGVGQVVVVEPCDGGTAHREHGLVRAPAYVGRAEEVRQPQELRVVRWLCGEHVEGSPGEAALDQHL